tara:strand:+ start:6247 stop:8241 length:1995 start_codon:yes stop_codon:yes gene_type:complete
MAVKKVVVLIGQSNMEGRGVYADLPAALKGAQTGRYVYNYDNDAREVLNAGGVGANLPNNTTGHVTDKFGPEMQLASDAYDELGEIDIFKYSVDSSGLGPSLIWPFWHPRVATSLYANFVTRFNAMVAHYVTLGHTIDVQFVAWYQGETDSLELGNDLAYYGNFINFIATVRAYLDTYSLSTKIRWITYLLHEYNDTTGTTPLINMTKNVRGAQLRAGWSDPEYRVIETNHYSYLSDIIHVDSAGQIIAGADAWVQWKSLVNNSMALETYDLGSLRTRLGEEFGIDITISANALAIDRRINDAVTWIVNRRKNWPFLERQEEFTVGEPAIASLAGKRYGAGVFTLSSPSVVLCSYSGTPMLPREIVDVGGSETDGVLVESIDSVLAATLQLRHRHQGDAGVLGIIGITIGNPTIFTVGLVSTQGNTVVLPVNVPTFGVIHALTGHTTGDYDGNWVATRLSDTTYSIPVDSTTHTLNALGLSQVASEFVIGERFLQVPDDFIRSDSLHSDDSTSRNTIRYKNPTVFERHIKDGRVGTTINRIYTVQVDPLNISNDKFIAFYPHYIDREVLFLKYFGDAKKMVADTDVSDIPRSDSFALWNAAAWFVAQWQKEDTAAFYRAGAIAELERMTKEYQMSDDITEDSDDRHEGIGDIQGPGGFPEFDID